MEKQPDISVITVNYNGLKDTCELVDSLLRYLPGTSEIIVVDNGSAVNEAVVISQRYPSVKTIRSEKNLGFAGGNNLGIREAGGEFIFFLNNDAYITAPTVGYLTETLRQNPGIGGVSPKIKFADSPQHIQFAGYTPLSPVTMRNDLIGFGQKDNGQFDTPSETPYLHGAAMMFRNEAIRRTGLMPEIYFLYYEEIDWCTHFTRQGYRLAYDPRCTVYHKESRSTGQASPLRTFYLTRNRLLYAYRNRQGLCRAAALGYQLMIAAPKNIIVFCLKRKIKLATATWQGCCSFFKLRNKMQDGQTAAHC